MSYTEEEKALVWNKGDRATDFRVSNDPELLDINFEGYWLSEPWSHGLGAASGPWSHGLGTTSGPWSHGLGTTSGPWSYGLGTASGPWSHGLGTTSGPWSYGLGTASGPWNHGYQYQYQYQYQYLNPDIFRYDREGNLIRRDLYGSNEKMGWVIDHKFPQSRGGGDQIDNLQPLQTAANRAKSDKFPYYGGGKFPCVVPPIFWPK